MSNGKHETIADILRDMHYCAEKNSAWCCTTVEFETFADRIEAAEREREAGAEAAQIIGEMVGREASKNQSVTNCNRLGNAAKMREALINAYYAMFKFIKTPYYEYEEMSIALDGAIAALAAPPRNCDRPECSTTKAAQDVWRQEDGGKTAYYEWLLSTSTKGEAK